MPRALTEVGFWRHVNKSEGCWEWQRSVNQGGHGQIRRYGKSVMVHRWSWEMANGPISRRDVRGVTGCDNPPCVRPSHLFLGTLQDNVADMVAKGRSSRGASRPGSRLTEDNIYTIRRLSAGVGLRQEKSLALFRRELRDTTDAIPLHGRKWRHVPTDGDCGI